MELENTNRRSFPVMGIPIIKRSTIMFVILGLMILFYVTEWLSTAMTAMCAAMLCILTGCTNTKSIRKNMDWDTILFLAFCLGLAVRFKHRWIRKDPGRCCKQLPWQLYFPNDRVRHPLLPHTDLKQLYHQLYGDPDRTSHSVLHWNCHGLKSYDCLPGYLLCSKSCLLHSSGSSTDQYDAGSRI